MFDLDAQPNLFLSVASIAWRADHTTRTWILIKKRVLVKNIFAIL